MRPRGIRAQLLDLLFPPRCQVCRSFSDEPLCETCRGELLLIGERHCPCCGGPLRDAPPDALPGALCADCRDGRWISGARSVGLHAGALRDAMIAYKFDRRTRLAETFAEMLIELFRREVSGERPGLPLERCCALIPVPLHPKRRAWRGFDQAKMLCDCIARPIGLPVWADALERTRDTRPQTQLAGASRRENVSGAFEARRPWRLTRASLILVDDVMTTGATLDECARALKRAGAASVYALTVSRAAPGWHPASMMTDDAPSAGGSTDA